MPESALETTMARHILLAGLPVPTREHRFHSRRKWRLDFAWPEYLVALETEGGIHSGGRHTRGKGFEEDCVKYNEALVLGWRVLRVTSAQVASGEALVWLESLLESVEVQGQG